jgi:hypothetical protein
MYMYDIFTCVDKADRYSRNKQYYGHVLLRTIPHNTMSVGTVLRSIIIFQ